MTRGAIRIIGVAMAVIVYVSLDTYVTSEAVHNLGLNAGASKVVLIGSRGLELTAFLALSEWITLRLWGRRVLGLWAYYSESGNFGLAEIRLTDGEFEYRVQLYKTAGEVAAAMEGEDAGQPFAHVTSQLSKYTGDTFHTDYRIEYSVVGQFEIPSS